MDDRKRDENSGRFSEEYPREDFLRALAELGLEEEGEVESRKVGNALLWELVDES